MEWAPNICHVDITSGCNARCIMCTVYRETPHPLLADTTLLNRLINLSFPGQVFRIGCSSEPTLHPGLPEFIHALTERSVEVHLLTNGKLLSKFVPSLCDAGTHMIRISLDSLIPDVFSAKRRSINLECVLDAIERINNWKQRQNQSTPILGLAVTVMEDTLDELPALVQFCSSSGIASLDYGFLMVNDPNPELMSLSPFFYPRKSDDRTLIAENIAQELGVIMHPKYFSSKEIRFVGPKPDNTNYLDVNYTFQSRRQCDIFRDNLWITPSGDLLLCNRVRVGSIFDGNRMALSKSISQKVNDLMTPKTKEAFCNGCLNCYIRRTDRPDFFFSPEAIEPFGTKFLIQLSQKELTSPKIKNELYRASLK